MSQPTNTKRKSVGVEVKNLSKSFGKQKVLHEISLSIAPGEIFVIMGPSGTGKSVLLRSIAGLETPDSGTALLDGLDVANPETREKIVTAMVFQSGALFNSMTVYDNLALYPREHRLYDKATLDEKVKRTLSILGIEEAAQKTPAELSGGMKKRVAIARALMMEPQVLLYDEPTSELDPTTAAMIAEIIGTLKEEFNVTSIVVSHDRELALAIGNRIATMFSGSIHSINTPAELRATKDTTISEFLNPVIDTAHPRFRKK